MRCERQNVAEKDMLIHAIWIESEINARDIDYFFNLGFFLIDANGRCQHAHTYINVGFDTLTIV